MTRNRKLLILPVLACVFMIGSSQAQLPPHPRQTGETGTPIEPTGDETRDRIARDMAKKANEERQLQLKKDTDKLLKLATELKDYVDKSNEHVLSLEVVKKAEEIEKLAKSVKEKMKGPN